MQMASDMKMQIYLFFKGIVLLMHKNKDSNLMKHLFINEVTECFQHVALKFLCCLGIILFLSY